MNNEQLVARIQSHENEADNMLALWKQNRGIIRKIAMKYTYAAEMEDLEQEGYFGLCEAVRHYNPERNVAFISYATYWIKEVMSRYVENFGCTVRIPSFASSNIRKYFRVVAEFEKNNGYAPSDSEITGLLGITCKELHSIRKSAEISRVASLDNTMQDGSGTLLEFIPSSENMEEECIKNLDRERMSHELWIAIEELPADQKELLCKKYVSEKTLKEIGEAHGIPLHTINTLIGNSLRKLRSGKHSKSLREYYEVLFPTVSVKYKGVGAFQRDHMSTTEGLAIKKLEGKVVE